MRRSILLSLLVIGAVAAMIGGASWAVLSDTERSTGNTYTAGLVDLKVNGQNPLVGAVCTAGPLGSNQTVNCVVDIKNVGNLTATPDIHIVSETCVENGRAEPETLHPHCNLENDNHSYWDLIYDSTPDNDCGTDDGGETVVQSALTDAEISTSYDAPSALAPNATAEWCITFHTKDLDNGDHTDQVVAVIDFTLHE